MNYGIQYLAHLVQTKNEINRRRRRFWALKSNPKRWKKEYTLGPEEPVFAQWVPIEAKEIKAFPKAYCEEMYKLAQEEMKAMTPTMRTARKEINARFQWDDNGAIVGIRVGNREEYDLHDIARMAELYKADSIILGD